MEQQLAALNPQFVTFRATVMDRVAPSQHLASIAALCNLEPHFSAAVDIGCLQQILSVHNCHSVEGALTVPT